MYPRIHVSRNLSAPRLPDSLRLSVSLCVGLAAVCLVCPCMCLSVEQRESGKKSEKQVPKCRRIDVTAP